MAYQLSIRPVRISPKVYIPLSIFMIIVSIGTTYFPVPYGDGLDWPVFTTHRDPESGLHVLNHRAFQVPRWFHQGLKGLTSALWSVLIPLQHSQSVRKQNPTFHRTSGYIATALSVELGAAGYWMVYKGWTTTHENNLHFYMLYGIPLPGFAWPTFNAALIPLGIFFYGSMIKLIIAARARRIESHRRWAVIHTMWGYAIAIERGLAVVLYGVAWAVHLLPDEIKNDVLGFPTDLEGQLRAEVGSLAWTLTAAGLTILAWTYYEWKSSGVLAAWWNGKSVKTA